MLACLNLISPLHTVQKSGYQFLKAYYVLDNSIWCFLRTPSRLKSPTAQFPHFYPPPPPKACIIVGKRTQLLMK